MIERIEEKEKEEERASSLLETPRAIAPLQLSRERHSRIFTIRKANVVK